jgi:hypothetical protein
MLGVDQISLGHTITQLNKLSCVQFSTQRADYLPNCSKDKENPV